MHFAGRLIGMPKSVQIRNVPDDIHRELRIRAAEAGMSLSDYLREELLPLFAKPPIADVLKEMHALLNDVPPGTFAKTIRQQRDEESGDSQESRQ